MSIFDNNNHCSLDIVQVLNLIQVIPIKIVLHILYNFYNIRTAFTCIFSKCICNLLCIIEYFPIFIF